MLETIAFILWLALCYLAGYLLGAILAEFLNSYFREEILA